MLSSHLFVFLSPLAEADAVLVMIGPELFTSDFMTLFLSEGHVVFAFDTGAGLMYLETTQTYNDDEWHTVSASRLNLGEVAVSVS